MSSVEKIKRLYAKSHITVSSEVDDKIIRDALTAFDKSEGKRWISSEPNLWRIIIASKTTKVSVATVVIIATVAYFSWFDGAPGVTSSAFARMRQSINRVPWMHLTLSIKDEIKGDYECETWYSPERKIVAGSSYTGAYWRNYLSRQRKLYEKASDTLTTYYERGEFSDENTPPWNYLSAIFGPELIGGLNVTLHTEESQGERVNVYEFVKNEDGKTARFKILAGINDNLPRTISVEAEDVEKGNTVFVEGICRYSDDGPEDIYDLGVPKDVTVINNLPSVEAKELIDICNAYRENFTSYIVVVISGSPSLVVDGVYVNYINGNIANAGRFFKYLHFSYGFLFDAKRDLFEKEVEDDFDSFLDSLENKNFGKLVSISLWDGEHRHKVRKGKSPYEKSRSPGSIRDIGLRAWPVVMPMGEVFQDEYCEQENLIGLKAGGMQYYFDPEHDYICVKINDGDLIREVRELARTENGSWYPRRIELTIIERDTEGVEVSREVTNVETLFVKMVPEFPEGTFDPVNLPRSIE